MQRTTSKLLTFFPPLSMKALDVWVYGSPQKKNSSHRVGQWKVVLLTEFQITKKCVASIVIEIKLYYCIKKKNMFSLSTKIVFLQKFKTKFQQPYIFLNYEFNCSTAAWLLALQPKTTFVLGDDGGWSILLWVNSFTLHIFVITPNYIIEQDFYNVRRRGLFLIGQLLHIRLKQKIIETITC